MRRCRETAAPYLKHTGLEAAEIDARFGEVRTPDSVGDRRAWLAQTFPWRAGAGARDWADVDPALREWRDQVLAHARTIRDDTVVFTHFIATNALVGAALAREETIVFRPDYASITELEVNEGAICVRALGAEMHDGEVR